MNWSIKTHLPISYDIKNSFNLFDTNNNELLSYISPKRILIVIDEKVNEIYFDKINKYFIYHKIDTTFIVINGVESEKNVDNLLILIDEIEKFGVDRRNEPILAIGGGVIQDIVGLAATLYRRGVPYIKVPTTLLGIVDVSVAAKTGINFKTRRNRLGSYYPPTVCFLDKSFLKTVEKSEMSSGMGEILKMAVIKDYDLFILLEKYAKDLLQTNFEIEISDEVINKSVYGMICELENNLWEKDLKRCVDFGHSFSPIIEMRSLESKTPLSHGQAVVLDVIFSSVLSYNRKLLSKEDLDRIIIVAKNMGLEIYCKWFSEPTLLLESLQDTTKHRNGNQNLPVPVSIGNYTFLNDVSYDEICTVANLYKEFTYGK